MKYETIIFDCDGVLLDSNRIKTEAFYEIALPYGEQNARLLTDYHINHGGISRFEKFKYFLNSILQKEVHEELLNNLLEQFGTTVKKKLIACPLTDNFHTFFSDSTINAEFFVVSGGMQEEIRTVFREKQIDHFFINIYGSPDNKATILSRELSNKKVHLPALFVGDSKYDYDVSSKLGLDFIFMYQYSEFPEWQQYFQNKPIKIIKNLGELKCHIT
jgi:phosphoglycolate phosphatase-like HAD superfamily hydrolase